MDKGCVYWITGLSGAGKTTLGNKLYYKLKENYKNTVILDGDILKKIVSNDLGYSKEDRLKRGMIYSNICKVLADQGVNVICCTIAMFDSIRNFNRENIENYIEVFLDVPMEVLRKRDQKGMYSKMEKGNFSNLAGIDIDVEFPKNPDIIIKSYGDNSISESVLKILNIGKNKANEIRGDKKYWNSFYAKKDESIQENSKFSEYVMNFCEKGKKIIDLGCGNGRDSGFFYKNGLKVTAVDSSNKAISFLKEKYNGQANINLIEDDFINAKTLFAEQYDYAYSRFSIHAIDEKSQDRLINNVYNALKSNGLFFIEVRSVNDELYGRGKKLGRNEYFFDNHYRRFIVREELENNLKKYGFTIQYSKESQGFAPYKNLDPMIIRIVAKK